MIAAQKAADKSHWDPHKAHQKTPLVDRELSDA